MKVFTRLCLLAVMVIAAVPPRSHKPPSMAI